MAQLGKLPTLGFSSGHDVKVLGWSPVLGSVPSRESAKILSPSSIATPPHCFPLLKKITAKHDQNCISLNTKLLKNIIPQMYSDATVKGKA